MSKTTGLSFLDVMRAPPPAPTANPPPLCGPRDDAGAWHRAIGGKTDARVDDPLGMRSAAASWSHAVEAGTTADAEQRDEVGRMEAERLQQARDALQPDLPPARCY